MSKLSKKSFVLGLTTGLVVAGVSLVFANTQIQAILNNQIKITLDGQVQEFRDETTNEVQYPITYNNRTYLPLRTLANLVGVGVDYDANTNTAILNSNNTNISESEVDTLNNSIKNFAEVTLGMNKNDIEKYLVDIDCDGVNELVQVHEDYPGKITVWAVDKNNNNNIISLTAYNKKDNSIDELSDYYFRIHKAKDKTTNKEIHFLSKVTGDGLCFEYLSVYALEKKGNELFLTELFGNVCDQEIEERLRAELEKDLTLTDDELFIKRVEAHTLKYNVDGKKVNEEEYNAYVNSLKEKYELIKTVNDL